MEAGLLVSVLLRKRYSVDASSIGPNGQWLPLTDRPVAPYIEFIAPNQASRIQVVVGVSGWAVTAGIDHQFEARVQRVGQFGDVETKTTKQFAWHFNTANQHIWMGDVVLEWNSPPLEALRVDVRALSDGARIGGHDFAVVQAYAHID